MNSTHNDQHEKNNVTGVSTPWVKQHKDKLHQTLTMQYPSSDITVSKDVQGRAIHSTWSNGMYKAGQWYHCQQGYTRQGNISYLKWNHCQQRCTMQGNISHLKWCHSARMYKTGQCILPAQWYQQGYTRQGNKSSLLSDINNNKNILGRAIIPPVLISISFSA